MVDSSMSTANTGNGTTTSASPQVVAPHQRGTPTFEFRNLDRFFGRSKRSTTCRSPHGRAR